MWPRILFLAQFSWDAATVATLNPTTRRTDNEM